MCAPMIAPAIAAVKGIGAFKALTIASGVAGAASTIAGHSAAAKQANAYNQAAQQNIYNANQAANNAYANESEAFAYESRANQQEAYRSALSSRASLATSRASTAGSGLDLGSLTVSDILNETRSQAAMSQSNYAAKQADMRRGLETRYENIRSTAEGRINSMPFQKGPSRTALAINLVSDGLNMASKLKAKK